MNALNAAIAIQGNLNMKKTMSKKRVFLSTCGSIKSIEMF